MAKCNVSEVPLEAIHSGLDVFEECLEGYGYGIYCIDYTQDFSGVLHREALVRHLQFREEGDFCGAIGKNTPTILDNTGTVGNHVCTWIDKPERGPTTRTKVYNKIVSNFEAGEIREPVGGHLADYADCPNPHLRKTFIHPDVQARGCTRVEVSVYAPPLAQLSNEKAADCIGKVLQQVSAESEEEGVFVVQPPRRQWENLAKKVDRCLVLADRPQGRIFVAWYAHTRTGRISGVHVRPSPAKVRDKQKWERAVSWAAGDFGFRNCPIFRVDILSADKEGVEIGPLRCYTKDENSPTILSASKKPTQLHPNGGDLATLLPPTEKIEWEWRSKKCHAIGNDSSKYFLQEIPQIAEKRQISTLSTRGRLEKLLELRRSRTFESWKRKVWQKEEKIEKARQVELKKLRMVAQAMKKIEQKSAEILEKVAGTLGGKTQKVAELPTGRKFSVLGFRAKLDKARVVLQYGDEPPVAVWATKGLRKILLECLRSFRSTEKDYLGRKVFWLVACSGVQKLCELAIGIEPAKTFQNSEGETIVWNPIKVLSAPETGKTRDFAGNW